MVLEGQLAGVWVWWLALLIGWRARGGEMLVVEMSCERIGSLPDGDLERTL